MGVGNHLKAVTDSPLSYDKTVIFTGGGGGGLCSSHFSGVVFPFVYSGAI